MMGLEVSLNGRRVGIVEGYDDTDIGLPHIVIGLYIDIFK